MSALEQLFTEWRQRSHHSGRLFITDGPIDPLRWASVDKRVLFLGKEAYGDDGDTGTWDLPTLVRKKWGGPKHKFWWTAAYWALAVRNTTETRIATFPEYTGNYESARQAVMEMAILNLKKSAGKSLSTDEDLKIYAKADGDLIKKQFNLLDPHIIICCNTWHLVSHLFEGATEVSQYIFRWGTPSRVFINYWHPSNQFPNSVMFYALCALYQESLKANNAINPPR